jgi:hypothetical protein
LVLGSPGTVERAEPLRNDPFAAELAGVLIDDIAVADEMLVDDDARMRAAHQFRQRSLALFERRPAQIIAVEFDQVESTEQGGVVVAPGAEPLKDREPGFVPCLWRTGEQFQLVICQMMRRAPSGGTAA